MTGRKTLIALDLATSTGVAGVRADGKVWYLTHRIAPPGTEIGAFLSRFETWLSDLIAVELPDAVVFEAPWVGPKTSQDTARKLLCLAGETEKVCYRRGLRCFEANLNTVCKFFTGSGGRRADKKAMVMRMCQAHGWSPEDDDQADALALLAYARHRFKDPEALARPGPLFVPGAQSRGAA